MRASRESRGADGNTSTMLKRKPSRLVRAITQPQEVIASLMAQPKEPDPNAKRLEDFKFARTLGGRGIDYGLVEPDKPKEIPAADSPIFPVAIDADVVANLPKGYSLRSLQRGDYDKGFCKLKSVGEIARSAWDERCEYFRSRHDTYTVIVITDNDEQICATGTLLLERKLADGLSLVGHIDDLAVSEGQKGKCLGLILLDQLDRIAATAGCVKTVVRTQETNEAFHKQKGFKCTGIEMTHFYRSAVTRMLERSRSSEYQKYVAKNLSRNASTERMGRAYAMARLNESSLMPPEPGLSV